LDEGNEHRWVVPVRVSNGATLNVEVERTDGTVDEIKDVSGPFDYDLPSPLNGLITFTEAKVAVDKVKPGELVQWEVKPPTSEYEFYVRDSLSLLWEVKLDAASGTIRSVTAKDKPD
jgi:hypothetical protein